MMHEDIIRSYLHTRTSNNLIQAIEDLAKLEDLHSPKQPQYPTLDDLDELNDTITHVEWLAYVVEESHLHSLVDEVKKKGLDVLRATKTFHTSSEELVRFCRKELTDSLSDEEVIAKITPYDDGAYTRLPEYVDILAALIWKQHLYVLWVRLVEILNYFPLQGALLYDIKTVNECQIIIDCINDNETISRRKVLLYLLRERMFELMRQEIDYLNTNSEDDELDEQIRLLAEEEKAKWADTIKVITAAFYEKMLVAFGIEDMIEWYSKKYTQAKRKSAKYAKYEFETLSMLDGYLEKSIVWSELFCEKYSLDALLYLAKKASEADNQPKEFYVSLIDNITQHIYTDRGYIVPTVSEDTINCMREVYSCVIKSNKDWTGVSDYYHPKEKKDDEEYYKALFRAQVGDGFWLATLLLMGGETNNQDLFNKVVSQMIEYCDDTLSSNDAYFLPLYIGEIVVSQIFMDRKDEYECAVIDNVERISLTLRALSANAGIVSDKVKQKLKNKKEEWDKEFKILSSYDKRQADFLNDYYNKASNAEKQLFEPITVS